MTGETRVAMGLVRECGLRLIEHFDGVLILGSGVDEDGNTVYCREQRGNLHAIEGAVREWVRKLEGYELGYHSECGRRDAERQEEGEGL